MVVRMCGDGDGSLLAPWGPTVPVSMTAQSTMFVSTKLTSQTSPSTCHMHDLIHFLFH